MRKRWSGWARRIARKEWSKLTADRAEHRHPRAAKERGYTLRQGEIRQVRRLNDICAEI